MAFRLGFLKSRTRYLLYRNRNLKSYLVNLLS